VIVDPELWEFSSTLAILAQDISAFPACSALSGFTPISTPIRIYFFSIADYFLTTLLDVSMRYGVAKVGAALTLPAESNMTQRIFPETNGVAVSVLEWECRFWANEVEEQIYAVSIDTTFHLFNPEFFKDDFLAGIRIAREGYKARHRPWFLCDFAPATELEFYRNSRVGHCD
jgi:hypothetical protein